MREANSKRMKAEYDNQKKKILESRGWDEPKFQKYVEWTSKLNLESLVPLFEASMKGLNLVRTRNPLSAPGAPPDPKNPNSDLDILFGSSMGGFLPNKQ